MVWLIIVLIVIILLLITFLLFYNFYFLRDPARQIPVGNNIVSPADGKVLMVKKFKGDKIDIDKRFLGHVKTFTKDVCKEGYLISIFMNIFDVHINRAPISGVVKSIKHSDGKFLNAESPESTFENENVQTIFQDGSFKIKVIQIAGLIARRIVPFIKTNEKIIKGQRMGLIKLGSQVTLILPANVKVKVHKGQRVLAGETIIATR